MNDTVRRDLAPERRLTKPYPDYSTNEWGLWKVMCARRSNRKYRRQSEPIPEDDLRRVVAAALDARRARDDSVLPLLDPLVVDDVRRGCYKGFSNKINVWLARSPVSGFLVLTLPREDVSDERPRAMPRSAAAVEDCVLWLTQRGLGTCWLGGLKQDEVARAAGLDRSVAIPAVVCFGEPKRGGAASYDRFTSRALSRSRKPLSDIACLESAEVPFAPREGDPRRFEVVENQDIESLISRLAAGASAGVTAPLELAVEASLEAARIAPSGGNSQRWRFVLTIDPEGLEYLRSVCSAEERWKAAVVAAGDVRRIETLVFDKPFWMLDVPIAISHISLMAASAGFGVEVITDMDEREVNRFVSLGAGERTVGVVGIY